jgi:hypothetical protein
MYAILVQLGHFMPDIFFLHSSGRQPQSEHRIFIYNKLRTQTNKTFF